MRAAGLSLNTIELFRAIFHRLDLDGDGTIDNQEMSMGEWIWIGSPLVDNDMQD